jgi:hypothetical protein
MFGIYNGRAKRKGKRMKQKILSAGMVVSICLLFVSAVSAQSRDDNRGGAGMRDARDRQGDVQTLTDQQKATVKSILSKYNSSTLTASDAKAIHSAFRDVGLHKGPGLNEAVKAAGFDPDKLRALDPPPDMNGRGNGPRDDTNQAREEGKQGSKQNR